MQFRVRVFEVSRSPVLKDGKQVQPEPVEQASFAVDSAGHDQAKADVKRHLRDQGHEVRSVSFAVGGGILAYVYPRG